jgi:indoleamine 2,3-dioxygenase
MVGSENIRRAGIEQNQQGKADEAKGQLQDFGEGIADRSRGAVRGVGAALTGDRAEEDRQREMHDAGKQKQKEAEEQMERRA